MKKYIALALAATTGYLIGYCQMRYKAIIAVIALQSVMEEEQ